MENLQKKINELHKLARSYDKDYREGNEIDAEYALEALMKFSFGDDYYAKLEDVTDE